MEKSVRLYSPAWQAFMERKMKQQEELDAVLAQQDECKHEDLEDKGYVRHNGAMDMEFFFHVLFPNDSPRKTEKRIETCTYALKLGGRGGRVRFPKFTFDRLGEKIVLNIAAIDPSKHRVLDRVDYVHISYFKKVLKPLVVELCKTKLPEQK